MHRLHSTSSIWRFRLAALLLCANWVLLPIAGGVVVHALIISDRPLAVLGIAGLGLTVLCALLQWLLAARTGCPLCMTPVLASKRCVTHRQARPLLGSHRLRVALTILGRGCFQCPYCAESTAIKVRKSKRRR